MTTKKKPGTKTHTKLETIVFTRAELAQWKRPPFQREKRENAKVHAIAAEIKETEVIPGVLTIGVFDGDCYLLDGQHRLMAYMISGCQVGYADVRTMEFESMAEMGEEFVRLNSNIVRLRPDDIMRGLEGSNDAISLIKSRCPFVGYDNIRRGTSSPIVSMSLLVRAWSASAHETPTSGGASAMALAAALTIEEASTCVRFIKLCFAAWGRDPETFVLWNGLNLTLCAWIYRRIVIAAPVGKTLRITDEAFKTCLMALSASEDYVAWLAGRVLSDSFRSPGYARIKAAFAKRLRGPDGKTPRMPDPAWSSSNGTSQALRRRG